MEPRPSSLHSKSVKGPSHDGAEYKDIAASVIVPIEVEMRSLPAAGTVIVYQTSALERLPQSGTETDVVSVASVFTTVMNMQSAFTGKGNALHGSSWIG